MRIANIECARELDGLFAYFAQIHSCISDKVLYNDCQQGRSFLKFHGHAMQTHSDSLLSVLVSGLVVVLVDDLGLCPVGEDTGAL